MIVTFFLGAMYAIVMLILSLFPMVYHLPFNVDSFLVSALGYVYTFGTVFWPFQPVMACLMLYFPLKIGLWVVKLIMGARSPISD